MSETAEQVLRDVLDGLPIGKRLRARLALGLPGWEVSDDRVLELLGYDDSALASCRILANSERWTELPPFEGWHLIGTELGAGIAERCFTPDQPVVCHAPGFDWMVVRFAIHSGPTPPSMTLAIRAPDTRKRG